VIDLPVLSVFWQRGKSYPSIGDRLACFRKINNSQLVDVIRGHNYTDLVKKILLHGLTFWNYSLIYVYYQGMVFAKNILNTYALPKQEINNAA